MTKLCYIFDIDGTLANNDHRTYCGKLLARLGKGISEMIRALICWAKGHKWGRPYRVLIGYDDFGQAIREMWRCCDRCGKTDYNAKDDAP